MCTNLGSSAGQLLLLRTQEKPKLSPHGVWNYFGTNQRCTVKVGCTVQKILCFGYDNFCHMADISVSFLAFPETKLTRMHSSRRRTVRYSGRLGGEGCLHSGVSAQGGCVPGGVSAWVGVVCLGGVHTLDPEAEIPSRPRGRYPPWIQRQTPPPCGQNDRRLWKHYLSATIVADAKNASNGTKSHMAVL